MFVMAIYTNIYIIIYIYTHRKNIWCEDAFIHNYEQMWGLSAPKPWLFQATYCVGVFLLSYLQRANRTLNAIR